MEWSTARPDWEERIVAGQSLLPDNLPINRARADKALRIFKRLKVTDVIGSPTLGESSPQWMFDFVWVIFGCYDPILRRQLIREFFILISKKNGKSTFAAGVMITALIMNERPLGEYMILAPTKEVADNSFEPAEGMIKADEALLARFHVNSIEQIITNKLDGSTLSVKSADANVVGGQKAIVVFVDELWLFGKKKQAANILSEATGSLVARPEGFVIYASTQSDEPPTGVFEQKLRLFRAVRDGTDVKPSLLALIFEYPQHMLVDANGVNLHPWRDERTWYIPNPGIDLVLDRDWLRDQISIKETEGLDVLSLFVSKHFNLESGLGLKSGYWVGAQFWLGNAKSGASNIDESLTFEEVLRRSEVVTIGVDGGGLDDLFGLAILGRCKWSGKLLLWNHAWAHEVVKDRHPEIASKLDELEAKKCLTFVKNPGDDVYQLADKVMEVEAKGLLPAPGDFHAIGVDSYGVAEIVRALEDRGFDKDRIDGIPQGWQLNGAIKSLERALAGGSIRHAGSPLMAFAVANAKAEPKGNAVAITKQISGTAKIDPLMATLAAFVLMGRNPEAGSDTLPEEYDLPVWG